MKDIINDKATNATTILVFLFKLLYLVLLELEINIKVIAKAVTTSSLFNIKDTDIINESIIENLSLLFKVI